MAHIGSFIAAAEGSIIGLTDHLFTRISAPESVLSPASSFACDAGQLAVMLSHFTPRSLLLIDEFGRGTLLEDGLALLASAVEFLGNLDAGACPIVVLTTHFTELLDASMQLLRLPNPLIELSSMKVVVLETPARHDEDQTEHSAEETHEKGDMNEIVFLYKVVEGVSTGSFGLRCASVAGVPSSVISRAEAVSRSLENALPIQALEDESAIATTETERAEAQLVQKFLDFDFNKDDVGAFMTLVREWHA